MIDFDTAAEDCSHDDLKYGDIELCEPEAVYENWYCKNCGANIIKA